MKHLLTHRFVFMSAWLVGVIALWMIPGYEARFLVVGGIIGYWPFALFGTLSDPATLISMFVLSAVEIGLCAWFMDRSRVPKKIWVVLLLAIVVGMSVKYLKTIDDFEQWKYGLVSHVCHPDYEMTLSDFRRLYLFPNMLASGVMGIYLATVFGVFCAIGLRVRTKRLK